MNAASKPPDELWVCHLGLVPYSDGVAIQETLRGRRQAGEIPDTLLLLEHPPVYTRGRRSADGELPFGADFYRAKGIDVIDTDRGGRITYHGPGQLVGYPIMAVTDVVAHLRTIEDAIVAALGDIGIVARGATAGRPRLHRRVGRGSQDRLARRARLARHHHARLRRQRRQRPRAVLVGRRVRAARRADDLGRRARPAACASRSRLAQARRPQLLQRPFTAPAPRLPAAPGLVTTHAERHASKRAPRSKPLSAEAVPA